MSDSAANFWTRIFSGLAYLGSVAAICAAVFLTWATDVELPIGSVVNTERLRAELAKPENAAGGILIDHRGAAVRNARVFLEVYRAANQKLYQRDIEIKEGVFVIRSQDLPLEPQVYTISVKAEAPFYLAGSSDHIVQVTEGKAVLDQREMRIRQTQLNPKLTLLLALPLLFGLLFTVLHHSRFQPSLQFTALYAVGTSVLWSVVSGRILLAYCKTGDALIPLFWADVIGPAGAVFFSFLGSLTYVAYSITTKPAAFYSDAPKAKRQKLLLTLGGRVLIAPYIAFIVLAVYGSTFPNYASGPLAAFLSFFTGLYIPAVLKRLNDLGMRLLSREQQAEVFNKARSVVGAEVPSQSAAGRQPSLALFSAVAEVREKLLSEHKTVIGVAAGTKRTRNADTDEQSIVVYVVEKQDLPEKSIPTELAGYPTDVQRIPDPDPEAVCHDPMLSISWNKVHALHRERRLMRPADAEVREDSSGVLLVSDPTKALLFQTPTRFELFDVIAAWKLVRPRLGERHDFVAFLLDVEAEYRDRNNFFAPTFNEVVGLGPREQSPTGIFDHHPEWDNPARLRGCQVHNFHRSASTPLTHRTVLHEIGHAWSFYVNVDSICDAAGHHWSAFADNGCSCMDHDAMQWVETRPGHWVRRPIDDKDSVYCPLDLYLMGLSPSIDVLPIRVLPTNALLSDGPVEATPSTVTFEEIVRRVGQRQPPPSPIPVVFRQAFVIVSTGFDSAEKCATRLRGLNFLDDHRAMFARATGGAATIETSL